MLSHPPVLEVPPVTDAGPVHRIIGKREGSGSVPEDILTVST